MIEIELLNPVIKDDTPIYDGPVNVVPSTESQTLETAGKKLESNVTIEATPLESKTLNISDNGQYSVTPDEAVGLSEVEVNVDVQPELQTKSVEYNANGQYSVTADSGYDGLDEVNVKVYIKEVEVPENDVEFIDYDGRIVYSYTKNEFLSLTEMPANPQHEGLIAQGWNWTLSDAKEYVTDCDGLVIGQMYITDDGKTRIYVSLRKGRLDPTIRIGVNGSVEIDWGDDSAVDVVTGTNLNQGKDTTHVYSGEGNYVISLNPLESSTFSISGSSTYWSQLIHGTTGYDRQYAYFKSVKKIEIGKNVYLGNYAFSQLGVFSITISNGTLIVSNGTYMFDGCSGLKYVTIPKSMTTLGSYAFTDCTSIRTLSIPREVTDIGDNCFKLNYTSYLKASIWRVHLPDTMTRIKPSVFMYCGLMPNITIPKSITYIDSAALISCYGLGLIKFTSTTPPTVGSSNVFQNLSTDCKIYVPQASLNAYKTATNYPNPNTYTYIGY